MVSWVKCFLNKPEDLLEFGSQNSCGTTCLQTQQGVCGVGGGGVRNRQIPGQPHSLFGNKFQASETLKTKVENN